jgi:hypothetical protein
MNHRRLARTAALVLFTSGFLSLRAGEAPVGAEERTTLEVRAELGDDGDEKAYAAIWIADLEGRFLATLYVNRGMIEELRDDPTPEALSVWAKGVRQAMKQDRDKRLQREPYGDAVTGATPRARLLRERFDLEPSVRNALEDGRGMVMMEFTPSSNRMRSYVWSARFDLAKPGVQRFRYRGEGDDGELDPDEGEDEAEDCVKRAAVRVSVPKTDGEAATD